MLVHTEHQLLDTTLFALSLSKYASVSTGHSVFIAGGESFIPDYQVVSTIARYRRRIYGVLIHSPGSVDPWKFLRVAKNWRFISTKGISWNGILLESASYCRNREQTDSQFRIYLCKLNCLSLCRWNWSEINWNMEHWKWNQRSFGSWTWRLFIISWTFECSFFILPRQKIIFKLGNKIFPKVCSQPFSSLTLLMLLFAIFYRLKSRY